MAFLLDRSRKVSTVCGMPLQILRDGKPVPFKSLTFPDGARLFRLESHPSGTQATIIARVQSSDDFMDLILAVDALREWNEPTPRLVLPCVPNQRQDRACVSGEPLGVLAFARQIAALGIKHVTMFDPHSEVTPAVFKALGMSVTVHTQAAVIGRFDALNVRLTQPGVVFVAPDAGSNKKVSELATIYGHSTFLRADKLRDLATGRIKEIAITNPREEIEGKDVVCADDLIDGGATFIGLAAALKAKGARRVELYATHAILSKGLDPLWDGGIDHIWTTNSYRTNVETLTARGLDRLTVLNLEETFSL